MNYIRAGRYNEALNVLSGISRKSAQWYYLSAIANNGLGNNVVALDHAQRARVHGTGQNGVPCAAAAAAGWKQLV